MKKIIYLIGLITLISSLSGCKKNTKSNNLSVSLNLENVKTENIGSIMPQIDSIGKKYIVMHSYIGLFVLDCSNKTIYRTLDLKEIDCNYAQGENLTKIIVSENEKDIYIYNENGLDYYCYNIQENTLEKTEKDDIPQAKETIEILDFNTALTTLDGNISNMLSPFKDNNITDVVITASNQVMFLYADDWTFENLTLVVCDEKSSKAESYLILK